PAPIASAATSVRPASAPSAPMGCRTSKGTLVRCSSFRLTTTSPTTRASCIDLRGVSVARVDVYRVDNADDGCIDRAVLQAGGHAGGAAADNQHGLADPRIHRVHGNEVVGVRFSVGIRGPHDHQFRAEESRILARGDNGPDDTTEDHAGPLDALRLA